MEFNEFVENVKEMVRSVGSQFTKIDDDWVPIMILDGKDEDGESKTILVGLDPAFFASDSAKGRLADEVMPKVIKDYNASNAAFICSAWMSAQPIDANIDAIMAGEEEYVPPSKDPNRIEIVQLTAVSGDAALSSIAPIYRDGEQPPGLGEWDDADELSSAGRFVDALRKAFT